MKKTSKSILSVILTLILILAIIPIGAIPAFAADTVQSGTCTGNKNISWTLDSEGVLSLKGTGSVPSSWTFATNGFSFPSKINVLTLFSDLQAAIEENGKVESYASDVKSIVIGEGITSIGSNCFTTCENAMSLTLPKTLKTIGDNAFAYTSITALTVPASVTKINSGAFYDADLETVTFEAKSALTTIGDSAFASNHIETIELPSSVSSIGKDICADNEVFKGFTVASGNKTYSAENYILYNADKTALIDYPDNATEEKVTIKSTVTTIKANAFTNAHITTLTIPSSVKTIEDSAFNCPSLREIYNLGSLKIIAGNTTFGSVAKYANVVHSNSYVSSGYFTVGDYKFITDGKTFTLYGYSGTDTNLSLPTEFQYNDFAITSYVIGENAFTGSNVKSVTIPNEVAAIGNNAFGGCSSLSAVSFNAQNSKLTKIGTNAFKDCTVLKVISLPANLTTIEDGAFSGCKSLATVSIPEKVTSIGASAFASCTSLKSIYFSGNSTLASIGNNAFSGDGALTVISLPETLQTIGNSAFLDCKALTEIAIPSSVKTIGTAAFKNCAKLKTVTTEFDSVLTAIPSEAFAACSVLNSFIVPKSVTSIEKNAFSGCDKMGEIYICNKGCSVDSAKGTIPADAVIYGYKFSSARNYALLHFRSFEDITAEHIWSTATCTKPSTCFVCGETKGKAKDHKFSAWTITTAATCTDSGLKTRTCSVCGKVETEVVPAKGHSYSAWTYVTDSSSGIQYKERFCSVCGLKDVQSIAVIDVSNPPEDSKVNYILGDVNSDGEFTAYDARLALRFSAKLDSISYVQSLASDVDKNGEITASDARKILRVSANLEKF